MPRGARVARDLATAIVLGAQALWPLPGTKPLWRIHAADVAPWLFDVGPDGRFNLAESGTCYLAAEPIGAFVEKFGRLPRPGGVIPEPLIDARRLSRLRPPKQTSSI